MIWFIETMPKRRLPSRIGRPEILLSRISSFASRSVFSRVREMMLRDRMMSFT